MRDTRGQKHLEAIAAYERRQLLDALERTPITRSNDPKRRDRARELRRAVSEGKYEAFLVRQAMRHADNVGSKGI